MTEYAVSVITVINRALLPVFLTSESNHGQGGLILESRLEPVIYWVHIMNKLVQLQPDGRE